MSEKSSFPDISYVSNNVTKVAKTVFTLRFLLF